MSASHDAAAVPPARGGQAGNEARPSWREPHRGGPAGARVGPAHRYPSLGRMGPVGRRGSVHYAPHQGGFSGQSEDGTRTVAPLRRHGIRAGPFLGLASRRDPRDRSQSGAAWRDANGGDLRSACARCALPDCVQGGPEEDRGDRGARTALNVRAKPRARPLIARGVPTGFILGGAAEIEFRQMGRLPLSGGSGPTGWAPLLSRRSRKG